MKNKGLRRFFRWQLVLFPMFLFIFLGASKFNLKELIFSEIENRLFPHEKTVPAKTSSIFDLLPGKGKLVMFSGNTKKVLSDFKKNKVLAAWSRFIMGSKRGGVSGFMAKEIGFKLRERDILKLIGDNAALKLYKNSIVLAMETKKEFRDVKNFIAFLMSLKEKEIAKTVFYDGVKISRFPGLGFPLYSANLGQYSLFSNKKNKLLASLDSGRKNTKENKAMISRLLEISKEHSYLAAESSFPIKNSFFPIIPPLDLWSVWLIPRSQEFLNIGFEGICKKGRYVEAYRNHPADFHDILKSLPSQTCVLFSSNAIMPEEIYLTMKREPYFKESFENLLEGHASPEKKFFPFIGPRFFYFCDGVNDEVTVPFLRQGIGIELHFKKDIRNPLNSLIREFFGIEGEPVRDQKRGREYFYFETETGITPCYSFFGSVLVVCLDKTSLLKIIDRRIGIGENLAEQKNFKKITSFLAHQYHHMLYLDLKSLWRGLKENLELVQNINNIFMVAGLEDDRFLLPKVLSLLKGGGATVTIENGKVNSRVIIH